MRFGGRWLLAGSLGTLLGWPGRGEAAELEYRAGADCDRADATTQAVEELIGVPLASVETMDFRLEVRRRSAGGWEIELAVIERGSGSQRIRVIHGPSCVEVTDAAAVAMALAIQGGHEPILDTPGNESAPPDSVLPAAVPMAQKKSTQESAAPKPRASEPALRGGIGVTGLLDFGTLPEPSFGLSGGAWLGYRRARLELSGLLLPGSEKELEGGQSAVFELAGGALLACIDQGLGSVSALGCGGYELGSFSGEGVGVTSPKRASTLWQALRLELGAAYPRRSDLRVLGRIGAAFPLVRRSFELDSVPVYRPPPVAPRLFLGLELSL